VWFKEITVEKKEIIVLIVFFLSPCIDRKPHDDLRQDFYNSRFEEIPQLLVWSVTTKFLDTIRTLKNNSPQGVSEIMDPLISFKFFIAATITIYF